ncbi:hypothetical protein KPL74_07825 [Bacillus sp. NP157]|nr:hypothetical protein KPL74_07825 [Bacillus sp. NP157]
MTVALFEVPENIRCHLDSEAHLRDMKLGGNVPLVEFDGTFYEFLR